MRKALPWVLMLAWLPVLAADFYWDDHPLVLSNPQLSSIAAIFRGDLGGAMRTPFYRPLFLLTVALDQSLWPGWSPGYHLQNLLYHGLSMGLLFGLLQKRAGLFPAIVGTLLFGLHPVQSETVAWVSARSDLLCAAGVLGALYAAEKGWLLLTAMLTVLAALSKEQALLLPLALPLWRAGWGDKIRGREVGASGLGVLLVLLLRHHANLLSIDPEPRHLQLFAERWFLLPVQWFGWLSVPWPLTSSASLYQALPGPVWAAVPTVLGLGWMARHTPRSLYFLALSALFLAPSVIAVAATTLIGERYLYLSLAFLGVSVAISLPERARGVLMLWALVAVLLLENRLSDWRSEKTLVETAAEHHPDAYTLFRLGILRQGEGDPKAAFSAFTASLNEDPPFLGSCAPPLKLLVDIGALEQAHHFQQQFQPICGSRPDFLEALGP